MSVDTSQPERSATAEVGPVVRAWRSSRDLVRRVSRSGAGTFGIVVVIAVVAVAMLSPWITPHDPTAIDVPRRLEGPSSDYWLGTDHLGRDLLSRIIAGTRIALKISMLAVLIGLGVGVVLGLLAGYLGGVVDTVVVIVVDAIQSVPAVILALTVLALLGSSTPGMIAIIGAAMVPGFARVTRSSVLTARQNPYIDAERGLGAGRLRILLVHVLPNVVAPLLVLTAMSLPSAIATESGLAFLGLGVQPPTPDWGVILKEGFDRVFLSAWPVVWTCLMLAVVTLGFTFLGERIRDVLDVRTDSDGEGRR
ncbi:ABC transporter permease [Nocardioidaceae bacterium SCSIO 66511]|nr:ABC transporter permease [Nocardioidaceae bacterium SCSIO 66511]